MSTDVQKLSLQLERAVVSLDRAAIRRVVSDCLACRAQRVGAALAGRVFGEAFRNIGDRWQQGALALSQLYLGARACEQTLLEVLPPGLAPAGGARVAAAALADRHALDKTIVSSVLRSSGHPVVDYGVGLSVEGLVGRTVHERPHVLVVSTLLLPSALQVKTVCERLVARGASTRVVVSGPPFVLDRDLWRVVGADAVARDAGDVPAIVERLLAQEDLLLEDAI